MRIQTTLLAVLLSLSFSASAENYIINQAYEISLDDLQLPGNVVGRVSFKDCEQCERLTLRVSVDTRYILNGRDTPLEDFRMAINTVSDKTRNISTVIHNLQSDTVIAVHVVK